jgi:hypothetical protein
MKNREPAFPRTKEERCDHCWAVIGQDERTKTRTGIYCSEGCADEDEDAQRSAEADLRESGALSAEEYGR